MGNLKCATDPKQTFLDFGLAGDATVYPGRAVKETTAYDGVTKTWVLAVTEANSIAGVAAGLATGGGDVNNYTAGQPMQVYKMGSEAVVMLSGSVTDRTIPLVIDSAGKFLPASSGNQTFNAIARELGSAGEYITVLLCTGKWII